MRDRSYAETPPECSMLYETIQKRFKCRREEESVQGWQRPKSRGRVYRPESASQIALMVSLLVESLRVRRTPGIGKIPSRFSLIPDDRTIRQHTSTRHLEEAVLIGLFPASSKCVV